MTDTSMIRSGESILLYDALMSDAPERAARRVRALDRADADQFAEDIGTDRQAELMEAISSQRIADSIMQRPEDTLTDEDWADLRAADF